MSRQLHAVMLSTAFALGLALLCGQTRADEPKSPLGPEAFKALEEAARPGAEHKKLDPLAGDWSYTCKFWLDPNQPAIESSGTIARRWVLGGRFLEERVVGKGPDAKDFEGLGVIGYDKPQGKYTCGWISSMGTGIATGLGTCDASGKHFTFKTEGFCPLRKAVVQGRDDVRIESANKHILTMYQHLDGKEVKMMELTAVRTNEPRSAERETPPLR